MIMSIINVKIRVALTVILLFTCALCRSQNIWSDYHKNSLTLDLNRPFFDEYDNYNFPTIGISLFGRYSISDRTSVTLDVPAVYGGLEGGSQSNSDSTNTLQLGNIYLGLEFESKDRTWLTEVGIRLPTFSGDVRVSEVLALNNFDRVDTHYEFFTGSISARTNYFHKLNSDFQLRFRAGMNLFTGFNETLLPQNELLADYSTQLLYSSNLLNAKAGISGQAWVRTIESNTSEQVINSFGMAASFNINNDFLQDFKPGLIVKFPLKEASEAIPLAVVGLTLTQRFPG